MGTAVIIYMVWSRPKGSNGPFRPPGKPYRPGTGHLTLDKHTAVTVARNLTMFDRVNEFRAFSVAVRDSDWTPVV